MTSIFLFILGLLLLMASFSTSMCTPLDSRWRTKGTLEHRVQILLNAVGGMLWGIAFVLATTLH